MKTILLLGAAAASIASPAFASADKPEQVSIPFAGHSIQSWAADGEHALYINANGQWYRAELMSACRDLSYANSIGFDSDATGSFDNFSSVLVDGQKCDLTSLTKSDGPPKSAKLKK